MILLHSFLSGLRSRAGTIPAFLSVWLLLQVHSAAARPSFELEGHQVKPGEKTSFALPVVTQSNDSTCLPITVIHGRHAGPVLGLIAGIHGYEYPPIIAMQQMARLLNADSLSGTVIIVHLANVRAFLGRSVYYNPADGKNLNREFPGNPNGSLSACIAWTLSQKILPRCNYLVDIHAGDASEDLHDYVGYYAHGNQTGTARRMAEALGFDWIIRSDLVLQQDEPSRYCSREAVLQGIPTVAIECGRLGTVSTAETKKINDGLFNMMRLLQLLPGKTEAANVPLEITHRSFITSEHTGIFYTQCKSGQLIRKGMQLGYITGLTGELLTTIYAPADGFIIYQLATPPVNKGEILFSLGLL